MADGLKRATLAALLTRGPWSGSEWTIYPAVLAAYYKAIRDGAPEPAKALGVVPSSRKADRANSLLRGAGLIRFNPVTRRWEAT